MDAPDYYPDAAPISDYYQFLERYDILHGELLRHSLARSQATRAAGRSLSRASTAGAMASSDSLSDSLSRSRSPGSSPRRCRTFHPQPTFSSTTSSSSSLDTVLEDAECEQVAEAQRLAELSEDIKLVLMGLLNCDEVRRDMALRKWVQSRLMETEQKLRSGRGERRKRTNTQWVDSY